MFFFIFSYFNSNKYITIEKETYVLNIIATLFILNGFFIDDYQNIGKETISPNRLSLLKIILGIVAGIFILLSNSFYFTGSSIFNATELKGIYPTIYIISGLVIIVFSFLKKEVLVIILGTMLFFLTLTMWFSSSLRSNLESPGIGMILMLLGSLTCMFINPIAENLCAFKKFDL